MQIRAQTENCPVTSVTGGFPSSSKGGPSSILGTSGSLSYFLPLNAPDTALAARPYATPAESDLGDLRYLYQSSNDQFGTFFSASWELPLHSCKCSRDSSPYRVRVHRSGSGGRLRRPRGRSAVRVRHLVCRANRVARPMTLRRQWILHARPLVDLEAWGSVCFSSKIVTTSHRPPSSPARHAPATSRRREKRWRLLRPTSRVPSSLDWLHCGGRASFLLSIERRILNGFELTNSLLLAACSSAISASRWTCLISARIEDKR